jgi:hypothetical protein
MAKYKLRTATALIALVVGSSGANAATDVHHGGVGKVHFPVSCNIEAQAEFDNGMALLHSFFWPETIKSFTRVTELDPSCAMAFWGLAQSHRRNPLIAGIANEKEAWAAVEKGLQVGAKPTGSGSI